jgi:DNA repair exonuclease SbcCD ATPase subunit
MQTVQRMDRWEEGFDTWTPPPAAKPADAADKTGTDLDREELLRLARELADRRREEQSAAQAELEQLKQSLRERAEAVATRERELDRLQRQLESGRPSVRGRIEELRAKRGDPNPLLDEESLASRERAALERTHALEARERAAAAHAAELEAEKARLAERERELAGELAAAQTRLAETAAERELTAAERERLEERDRAVHEVEKRLAAARIELEQEREQLEARLQGLEHRALEAQNAVSLATPPADPSAAAAALEKHSRTLRRLEAKLETRERELALMRQGVDAERNDLHERERALRRREIAEVRESFAPPLAPPSFSEGLAALARGVLKQ